MTEASAKLDHGVLNVSLSKRGNIDAQIDGWKRQQALERKAAAKAAAIETEALRERAKGLLDEAHPAIIAHLATRLGLSHAETLKRLRSEAHWQPKLTIRWLIENRA